MRFRPGKISSFLLALLLSLTAPIATTLGAVLNNRAAGNDLNDPAIMKPDEPGNPCLKKLTLEEIGKAKEAHVQVASDTPCLPQGDAFVRAAEAASYLAFYQMAESNYGKDVAERKAKPGEQEKFAEALRNCVEKTSNCDSDQKSELLKALIQYNYGKELKAQMLENAHRSENMKSVDLGSGGWNQLGASPTKILSYREKNSPNEGSLKGGPLRKNTFRLDPKGVEKLAMEHPPEELGNDFNRTFKEFVDTYSTSTGNRKSRWNYVTAVNSAGGNRVFVPEVDNKNLDELQGKTRIDEARLKMDQRMQDSPAIREIVDSYQKEYGDGAAKPQRPAKTPPSPTAAGTTKADPNAAPSAPSVKAADAEKNALAKQAFEDSGFQLPDSEADATGKPALTPPQIAGAVVVNINKVIAASEKGLHGPDQDPRYPSSVSVEEQKKDAKKVISVKVNVNEFDKFLDDIWPPSVPKPQ